MVVLSVFFPEYYQYHNAFFACLFVYFFGVLISDQAYDGKLSIVKRACCCCCIIQIKLIVSVKISILVLNDIAFAATGLLASIFAVWFMRMCGIFNKVLSEVGRYSLESYLMNAIMIDIVLYYDLENSLQICGREAKVVTYIVFCIVISFALAVISRRVEDIMQKAVVHVQHKLSTKSF